MNLYDKLSPQEKSFHDALLGVVDEHGKFPADPGVYVEYVPPAKNEDAEKGVKCGNCSFYAGGKNCMIIKEKVHDGGKCRFVTVPEGMVDYNDPEKSKKNAVDLAIKMGAEKKENYG